MSLTALLPEATAAVRAAYGGHHVPNQRGTDCAHPDVALRTIPGFPGYSITCDGRIWSHPKVNVPGRQGKTHNGYWMATFCLKGNDAPYVSIRHSNGKRTIRVKRLVEMAWEEV